MKNQRDGVDREIKDTDLGNGDAVVHEVKTKEEVDQETERHAQSK